MRDEATTLAHPVPKQPLKFLNDCLINRIDRALFQVGEFGEVRLVVAKGRLRFIAITQSENVKDE